VKVYGASIEDTTLMTIYLAPPQLECPYIFYEARQYLGWKGKGEEGGCNCIKFVPHEIDREMTENIRRLLEEERKRKNMQDNHV
jgi:hypothetical protein